MSDDVKPSAFTRLGFAGLLSVLGLVLSGLLVAVHLQTHLAPARDSFCSLGAKLDCASVAASPHAIFLGVPWAMWGVLVFLCMVIASWKRSVWLLPLAAMTALGSVSLFLVSLLLVGSLCFLCEAVHVVSIALAIVAWKSRSTLLGGFLDHEATLDVLAPSGGMLIALVIFLPAYWSAFSYKGEPPFATGETAEGHPWIGAEKPSTVIHEFVDYRCDQCRIASNATLRQLHREPGWRIVRRQHPGRKCQSQHKYSCIESRLAFCAGKQGKFWRADRWLFSHPNIGRGPEPREMANALDLNTQTLIECLSSENSFQRAEKERVFTYTNKISSAPSYLVDGKNLSREETKALFR